LPTGGDPYGNGAAVVVSERESRLQGEGRQVVRHVQKGKVREMREAETILTVIRERGTHGLPLERVYRLLFNRSLYLRAYAKLYPNKGAMTPGSTTETIDGMSLAKIDQIIDAIRHERYRWTPVRRVFIPKKNGKKRPLGLPTWSDKLVQEVMRSILEAYFEPQFSTHSHGFRPERGCHTALQEIEETWTGTKWFIEGDIAQYFDTIDHTVLIEVLRKSIKDERFLRLLQGLLAAGYLEEWKFQPTLSGAPQGGVISPLLSNIYLHEFDHWLETQLIPAYTKGDRRKSNPAYQTLGGRINRCRRRGQHEAARAFAKERRNLPSQHPRDPDYRRLRYVRYADDFLLGYVGTKAEAEEIKRLIKEWLQTHLKLTLSDEKTLITHATNQMARFLGYEITIFAANDKLCDDHRRSVNGKVNLRVPLDVIHTKCARYLRHGKIMHRNALLTESDYTIVMTYQQEYRGVVQYYQLAHNVAWLNRLHWCMRGSLLKTLASKHNTSVAAIARRLSTTTQTPEGKTLRCLEVQVERRGKRPLIARFGGISLTRQFNAVITDLPNEIKASHTELQQRVLKDTCELCGAREGIQVHHIRKLADLKKQGQKDPPAWVMRMARNRRKTLVVCQQCHQAIHNGKLALPKDTK
jgi:group II intron reverse transcriptase/maturase